MHRRVIAGIILLVSTTRTLSAQASGNIDVGTAFLDQPTIGSGNVLTAAAGLSYLTMRSQLAANAVAARTPNDLYTGQALVTAAQFGPPFRPSRWELSVTGSSFGLSGDAPSYGAQLLAREHIGKASGGGYAGISTGTVGQSGAWRRVFGAHGGGYLRLDTSGNDELSGVLAYTDAAPPLGFQAALRYADAFGYWQHRDRAVDLLVGGGARMSTSRSLGHAGWASAAAAIWVGPRLAVVVSAGRALEDVTRGVPSVRYFSLALRLGQRSPGATSAITRRPPKLDDGDGRLDVRATGDSLRLVTVRADSATTVELMGDFTDWEPVAMAKMPNGSWGLERPVAPGVHHVAIRIDGGPWRAPPNLTRAPDEFGGEVGILAVP